MSLDNVISMEAEARFREKYVVDPETGCWLWTACKSKPGYGRFRDQGKTHFAYKWAYERWVGPVPDGLVLDHIVCDNKSCVNPQHVKPTLFRTNVLRGTSVVAQNARKTHCHRNHLLAGDNVSMENGARRCITCRRERQRQRKKVA